MTMNLTILEFKKQTHTKDCYLHNKDGNAVFHANTLKLLPTNTAQAREEFYMEALGTSSRMNLFYDK